MGKQIISNLQIFSNIHHQDKAQPETQARAFGDVSFNAVLAIDDPSAMSLVRQPGSDGFRLDSTAMFQVFFILLCICTLSYITRVLYWFDLKTPPIGPFLLHELCTCVLSFLQVAAGREWYLHTIYTVRSKENANRGIGKRSLEYHSLVSTGNDADLNALTVKSLRSKRSTDQKLPEVAQDIGEDNNRGTNIMHIALDRARRRVGPSKELFPNGLEPSELNSEEGDEGLVTVVGALVGLLLTVLIIITIILVLKSRKKDGKEGWREGVQEVVKGSISTEPMLVVRMQDCHNSSEV